MMESDELVSAVTRNITARRIGEAELERDELEARYQIALSRIAELEAELEERPAKATSSRKRGAS